MALSLQKNTPPPALQDRLNDVIPGYRAYLEQQGLAISWINTLTATARHIVTRLFVNGKEIVALDIREIADFVSHDCSCPGEFQSQASRYLRSRADRFLTYLTDTGRVEMPASIIQGGEQVDAFICSLSDKGYTNGTKRGIKLTNRHFVVWLYLSGLATDQVDEAVIQQFLDHECACSCPKFHRLGKFRGSSRSRVKLTMFTDFLACEGLIRHWRSSEPLALRSIHIEGFLDWMRRHRGASGTTIKSYDRYLNRKLMPDLGDDPASYDVRNIRKVFANWALFNSSRQLAMMATVLRAYLRYLGTSGFCPPELVSAVPTVGKQPAANLPRYVSEADIEALIASCNIGTPVGMRDYAIMLLLARLALRPGDIVALRLSDIDWDQAHIRVSGKSRRSAALPLPQDAGDALKTYILQGRPRMRSEFVFLRARAPYRALFNGSTVSSIVRSAMNRAGIKAEGLPAAYVFRHSRATNLLRGGASLETVATLLRHRSAETTTLYARVDRPMLLEVAQPWPGDRS